MGKPRTKSQRERDRTRVSELYLKGWTQWRIATELNVTQSTVSCDIKTLIKQSQKSQLLDIDQQKATELEKINKIELEAWEAWERSKQDREIKSKKQRGIEEDIKNVEAQYRTITLVGDPRFLQQVQWCINKRCEIFGLDAPIRSEVMENMTFADWVKKMNEKKGRE